MTSVTSKRFVGNQHVGERRRGHLVFAVKNLFVVGSFCNKPSVTFDSFIAIASQDETGIYNSFLASR
eukprot:scaffold10429_cov126-Cylindrotheca_fusiformis.AAC.13